MAIWINLCARKICHVCGCRGKQGKALRSTVTSSCRSLGLIVLCAPGLLGMLFTKLHRQIFFQPVLHTWIRRPAGGRPAQCIGGDRADVGGHVVRTGLCPRDSVDGYRACHRCDTSGVDSQSTRNLWTSWYDANRARKSKQPPVLRHGLCGTECGDCRGLWWQGC